MEAGGTLLEPRETSTGRYDDSRVTHTHTLGMTVLLVLLDAHATTVSNPDVFVEAGPEQNLGSRFACRHTTKDSTPRTRYLNLCEAEAYLVGLLCC